MGTFASKVVFVTGGASGIGAAVVKAFSDEGATVCYCDLQHSTDESCYRLDVRNDEALESAMSDVVAQYGDIDIIINNVGISEFKPLHEVSIEEFDKVVATNLRPAFVTSRFLARHRHQSENKAKYGRIINISSSRYLQSEAGSEAYAASKGGIVSLTHALAISFAGYGITVNSISPGWIDTGKFGEISQTDHQQHPSGRVGRVEDIARMCLFIANPANDFLNGENIVIDGGMTKKMIYEE